MDPNTDALDRELLGAIARGDHAALARLYDRHAPALLGVAVRILGSRSDAEDLVHDVFLEAWARAAGFSPERGTVRTWLFVRLRSRAIDRLRNLEVIRQYVRREAVRWDSPPTADDPSDRPDRKRALAALATLSEVQRRVLEQAYFEGLSCAEIAARSGTPVGTVKSRMLAGIRALRRQLESGGRC